MVAAPSVKNFVDSHTPTRMSSHPNYSDNQLVLLLKHGDDLSFAEIYRRYQTVLFLYAQKKLSDEEESKDIVQEVFVALWKLYTNGKI